MRTYTVSHGFHHVSVCVAQFICPEDSQCVDYYKVCDQHPDCPEATDEMNCTEGDLTLTHLQGSASLFFMNAKMYLIQILNQNTINGTNKEDIRVCFLWAFRCPVHRYDLCVCWWYVSEKAQPHVRLCNWLPWWFRWEAVWWDSP